MTYESTKTGGHRFRNTEVLTFARDKICKADISAVAPGASHGLLVEKSGLCNAVMVDFLRTEPVARMAPFRRAVGKQTATR